MSVYVYGIASSSHPKLPEEADGIGDPPQRVRVIRHGRIAALVSDAPDRIRPKRRDLVAHQHILTRAGEHGSVLPLRFGGVSPDEESLTAVLAEREEYYVERLAALADKVEYNVKATHDEESVLRRVIADDPELRRMADAARSAQGGSHEQKVQLGERIAAAVQAREVQDAELLRRALEQVCSESNDGPQSLGWLTNISYLVDRDGAAALVEAVDTLRTEQPHLVLTLTGPLPPYSFVE
ncbi:GvpL/GvpF family gas vesicle protein [Streptomyces sp. NPDC001985]|uniref:GvpL/GvpF family gas vesicle protein n=1 Tax=Streptomyces sp. NPDC001985 TaxID=3154406 RepID=UPI003322EDB2